MQQKAEGPICVILGGGGHARVVIDCMVEGGGATPYAVLDADATELGDTVQDVPVRGDDEMISELIGEGVSHFVLGLGAVSDNRPRMKLFYLGLESGLLPLTVRHPTAVSSRWAHLGPGSLLCPLAVVNAGARLGQNVIVNSAAVVEHDCLVGDHVHVASGARLTSGVEVGDLAHVGAGATVRQGVSIGSGAVVGAGAVVVADVPAWTVVVGVPARRMRLISNGSP